jgi:lysozyme
MNIAERALPIAIDIIKRFEGCKLHAYRCPAGIWTCGWGETEGITPGTVWTQEHADAILGLRVRQFMMAVLRWCPALARLNPEKLAACTSLAYNIGVGAFRVSSVCRLTGRGEYGRAANSFLLWNKGGGRVLLGLTRRRQAERNLYLAAP